MKLRKVKPKRVICCKVEDKLVVIDGYHRLAVIKEAGETTINVKVISLGGREDEATQSKTRPD